MTSREKLAHRLWLIPIALVLTSTIIYFAQGGFGGGHGSFDRLLLVLGLPWCLLPLPGVFHSSDLIWLIAVPFLINSVLVSLLTLWLRKPLR